MKNSLYRFVKLYIGIDYLTQVFTITEKVLKFSSSKVSLKYMFHGKLRILSNSRFQMTLRRTSTLDLIFAYLCGRIIHDNL